MTVTRADEGKQFRSLHEAPEAGHPQASATSSKTGTRCCGPSPTCWTMSPCAGRQLLSEAGRGDVRDRGAGPPQPADRSVVARHLQLSSARSSKMCQGIRASKMSRR
jgi:hypothetical protein